jgi:diacylglycerol kinase family enzyme
MSYYILYNKYAGNGDAYEKATELAIKLNAQDCVYDMTAVDYSTLFTDKDADIIILGGDGTLNRFINDTAGLNLENKIFITPLGTGNDFLKDIEVTYDGEPIEITKYLKRLPVCEIDGKRSYFINGVGFGIDGYCCEEGDRQKAQGKKDINYTGIAIKGLLGKFKPRKVTITVDGEVHEYDYAWLAPVMWGRHYGGGMIATPDQKRDNEEGEMSVMLFHGKSKLKTLILFPSIFKGEHLKNKKRTAVFTGKEIIVEFETPCSAQIDGETVLNVKRAKYTAAQPVVALDKEEALV